MTPSRLVRAVVAVLLLTALPSFASAATTEFRVLFDADNDPTTGCTVNGMDGVDQVLVTQVTEGASARVTRTHRELCTGTVLGGAVDIVTTGWDAGWNNTNKLLTIETRVPFSAFGSAETMPSIIRAGFDATRNGSVHTSLANQNGTPIEIPEPPSRRRAIGSGEERHIIMDGALLDWGKIKPAVIGLASNGSPTLRLLRILAWPDTGDHHLYFAVTAYLGSDHPYADDNMYLREPGQSLMVGAPGVLNNDAIPGGAPLTAQKVSDPSRGTVTLNADGSFTYSPNHPQVLTDDEFEYRAVGGGKESNVARVVIQVNQGENPNTPQDDQYTTQEDKKKIVPAGEGVLANDPHTDLLVASLFSPPSHGTVVINADGGFTYTPAGNFSGTDTFVYTATKKLGAPEGIGGNATVTITVTPVNDAPNVSPATFSLPENSPNNTVVGTVNASDVEGDSLTYSIVGGNTGGAFSINSSTGQIRVANSAALDYETTPTFSLTVRASDGSANDEATITINLTNGNEPPVIVAGNTLNYTENDPATVIDGSLTVTDTDSPITGASVVISNNFAAGQDVLSFTPVGAITGVFSGNTLTLTGTDSAANYQLALRSVRYQNTSEDPSTAPRTITWTATDGAFTSTPVTSFINVLSVNDVPTITSPNTASVAENTTAVHTVTATDLEGETLTYSISGGADAAFFTINPTTGALSFVSAPNFEAPADAGANNVYDVTVQVSDGTNNPTQNIAVTVTDVNETPVFTSNATPSVPENTTAVGTVVANDPEGAALTYSITGGADAALFTINATTGALTFNAAPNFEAPADAGANNVYDIVVTASDGTNAPTQNITVTVTNVDESPVITSSNVASVPENTTAVTTVTASDEEGQTLTYSITGGADAGDFTINATTGALSFVSAPNFEAPADADANNIYLVTVQVSDGTNNPTQNITVTVTNVNEAPLFTSSATPSVPENTTAVVTVVANDPEGAAPTYSITGGADMALFSINGATGALTFNAAPDFEAPADADANNVYEVVVTASDGVNSPTQNLTVTVTNVNEAPTFTSTATPSVAENSTSVVTVTTNDPEGSAITYSITGGADAADFTINATTGELSFVAPPNYEAPVDADANNVYEVVVTASDGTNAPTQNITVTVTDVNEAPVFTSSATPSVAENTTAVVTVTTADQEGDTITYSITGGADMALFSINSTTGALTFNSAPDFDAPADAGANNVYDVVVTASDGTNSPTQNITVTVTDVNETPVFTSTATPSIPENTTAVVTVTTTDPEGDTITYSITGGADMALFSINSATGALSFLSAPNFEAPADAGANNVYDVVVTASDGTNNPTQNITVTVTDVNEAPVFTSTATPSVAENTTAVVTVTTTDQEGNTITYSITGGADAALFSINGATGALTFNAPPNFEAPADAGANNVYDVVVTASDGTNAPTQNISVTVTDVNEAPVFTSSATPSVPENTTAVITVTTSDPEGNTITYSITGGADMALFTINSSTGALSFLSAPDYDAPGDAGANNVYDVVVTASDGTNSPTQAIAVTVTDTNEAPVFTSSNAASVAENSTSVLTVTTTDQEGDTIAYSITGGADASLFSINSTTGALSFNAPPDFENPTDADANNIYEVTVTASDGTNAPTQTINVTVTDVNEGPAITSGNTASFDENATGTVLTVAATDPEGDTVTYAITGGADMADLSINATTGAVTFNASPNFEAPADSDTNNTYVIDVTVSSTGGTAVQTITITVNDVNEAPVINVGLGTFNVNENTTSVGTITSSDPDGTSPTYSIVGGADAADFTINGTTGALSFVTAPDFEAPADANADNVYEVTIRATDGTNNDDEAFTVNVLNVNEAPSFTSTATPSTPENTTDVVFVAATDPEGQTVTYSITGGADMALFSIDGSTGELRFLSAPNFEAPGDAGANNIYDVVVTASDGTNNPTQAIAVTVTDVNETPTFTSSATLSVAENTTAVVTVTASDPEGSTITYSITGGADAALFTINGTTGALSFLSAPNFEAPADAGANNVYDVIITASDGTNAPTQAIAVTVTDLNEAPAFTSSATPSVPENTTAVGTVTAVDPEGAAVTYSITGGADMALFAINSTTGALSFLSAPNFEAPADAGANNVYDVVVTATDGTNNPTQAIAVTVTNVNDAPVFTSSATPSVPENTTAAVTVTVNDQEGDTITYSITGGADMALFTIHSTTGALSFLSAPNFEAPADAGANNVYDVVVTASDGTNSPTQAIAVTVTDVNEAPSFTSTNNATVPENTVAVLTVTTTDPEGNTITYSITGGADAADFSINSSSGVLTFVAPPNFEVPGDADANNVYDVVVTASDGTNNPTQNITVTVTNAQEGPVFTSPNVANYAENGVGTVLTATAVDEDGDTVTYSITGGTDTDDLTINPTTGNITFNSSPNFEAPTDSDTNNTYVIEVTATSTGGSVMQSITITVTNVNEQPVITSGAPANVPENTAGTVHTVTATDPDGTSPTFAIVGGNDAADFNINATTGAITFVATPNFEAPADANADNVYELTVRATDGTLFDDEVYTITVTNVNEAPIAVADTYNAVGGTLVHISGSVALPSPAPVASTGDVQTTPRTTGVKANDTDPDTVPAFNTLTVTFVTGNAGAVAVPAGSQATTTTANGSVTMHSDGSFHYTPNAGYLGADSFTYTINDGANNATGTVNFTVHAPAIRYVKNNAPTAGNGTSATPHQTLAAAITASTAGEIIYVMEGDGTATNYGGSNVMKLNQKLWGQGVALSVTANSVPLTLIAATNRPLIGPGGAQETIRIQNAITGVDIQGLSINGGTTNAIDVTTTGGANSAGFSASNNVISAAGQEGIDVNHGSGGTVTVDVQTNTITSTGTGFDFARTGAGTGNTIVFSNNTVTAGAAGNGITISGGAATATTISGFANNNINGNTGATGVNVINVTFDAIAGGTFQTVNAGIWTVGASGNGVGTSGMLLGAAANPVSGDLSFTDLDVYADNGTALQVVGSGAIAAGTGTRVTVGTGVAVMQSIGGPAVDVTNATVDLQLAAMQSTNTTTRGVSLVNVSDGTTAARFSAPGSITSTAGATGPLFNVSGGNAGIAYSGTINNTGTGRAILVDSLAMDDATDDLTFSGAITENGAGILLNNNSGASRAITFSGGLTISTSTGEGFAATSNTNSGGTGGLHVTGTNTITSTSATALRITNTTIGSNNVTFRRISSGNNTAAADPASGIILTTTGAVGRLIVTGNAGVCSSLATCTGGAIQNTTSHGISLTSTLHPSFTRMGVQNTAGSGIEGTGVSSFTLQNSFIDNSGTGGGADDSNVAFNNQAAGTENNISGTVTITDNTLTNARWHGVMLQNFSGTIDDVIITGNTVTSATALASSLGYGINLQILGSASTVSHVTKGNISNNVVTNFPSGGGIQVQGGNSNAAGSAGTLGQAGNVTNIININSNRVRGQSAANRMNTSAILFTVSGKGQGNVAINNNGTVAEPLAHTTGTTIGVGANGDTTLTATTNGNVIESNHPSNGGTGISGGTGVTFGVSDTPDMTWTINNNVIDNTDGNGILAVARGATGLLRVKIQNNTVSAPQGGVRPGIRVDAGNTTVGSDDDVCLNMSGNSSAGSGGSPGLGLRKQGTSTTVHAFGVNGMAATSTPGVEAYVDGLNPAGGGTLLISATSGFTNCSLP
ncbi:MAG TPA: cadherin domain-containing protein [Thermoanaerobaculia bacterium]